jgi:predicted amidophosphoribosyltransferase
LEVTDQCIYLGEYTARKGYSYSPTNNLIHNLKKSPKLRETAQWPHKLKAVALAGITLRKGLNPEWLKTATLIPVPPSKARGHEAYDDRMLQVLRVMGRTVPLDIRELVLQRESTDADHEREYRRTPQEIATNYELDEALVEPAPEAIGVCDDVLTKGSHFKAMQMVLSARFPGVPIVGIFIARRVPQPDEQATLESLLDLFNL